MIFFQDLIKILSAFFKFGNAKLKFLCWRVFEFKCANLKKGFSKIKGKIKVRKFVSFGNWKRSNLKKSKI